MDEDDDLEVTHHYNNPSHRPVLVTILENGTQVKKETVGPLGRLSHIADRTAIVEFKVTQ